MDFTGNRTLGPLFCLILCWSLLSVATTQVNLQPETKETPQFSSSPVDGGDLSLNPDSQIASSNRRLEGSRLLEHELDIGLFFDDDDSPKPTNRRLFDDEASWGTLEDVDIDRGVNRFITNFENLVTGEDHSEYADYYSDIIKSNYVPERARLLDDYSQSEDEQQSNLIDHFIDKFITNYGGQSLQDIDIANLKNGSNLDENSVSNVTRAVSKTQCGGVITLNDEEAQTIISPNYPSNYPSNVKCTWTIIAQLGTNFDQIKLSILDLELERGICNSDYLLIDDLGTGKSRAFCGESYQSQIISMSNSMMINFVSDNSISKRGFKIEVKGIKATCGGSFDIDGEESFTFATPSYPSAYPEGSRCHWLISSSQPVSLELINYYGKSALRNMLKITLASFESASSFKTGKPYISKVISVTFTDDTTRKRDDFKPGAQFQVFPVKKTKKCNITVNLEANATSVISSTDYPQGYNDNERCSWTLKHELGEEYIMKLNFIEFDIEEHSKCEFDFFTIRDEGQQINRTYCGAINEASYKTSTPELNLYFQSDSYNVVFYSGFSIYVKVEKKRENQCIFTKNDRDTWVIKSPALPYVYPSYMNCDINIAVRRADRFKILFKNFDFDKATPCSDGDHVSLADKRINSTEYFCGDLEGSSIVTAGNDIDIKFSSNSDDFDKEFEIVVKAISATNCGGNTIMNPGTYINLRVPPNRNLDDECIWVVQGSKSILALEFKRGNDVRVSESGLFNDLFNYNARTVDFIDPSEKYMIVSTEERALIHVNSYGTYSECGTNLDIGREPVIITNNGLSYCPITIRRPQNKRRQLAIQYTLISLPSSCVAKLSDTEEGRVKRLCPGDWKKTYVTSSTEFTISPFLSTSQTNDYMLLVDPVKYTCGESYESRDQKILIKSKFIESKSTCIYRFETDGNRTILDIATSNRRSLGYLKVSLDGSFDSLQDLTRDMMTSFVSTKEFLVVIQPFPRNINFVIQVMKEVKITDECSTCLIVSPGSQGILITPKAEGSKTYSAGLSCDVKFEGNANNQTVIMEVLKLDIPLNTSLDALSIVKDGIEEIVEPSQLPPVPFLSLFSTPFAIRFKTSSDNEYKGYKIRYTVHDCGGVVFLNNESPVTIESPGYGDVYPTYIECVWHFETNITNISDRLRLEIKDLNIHTSDSLRVIDPFYDSEPVASLTGSNDGSVITSTGNQLRVIFKSDSRQVNRGFKFEVKPLVSGCGADIDTGVVGTGTISTINFFPDTEYCVFRFKPTEGRVMSLEPILAEGSVNPLRFPSRRKLPNNKVLLSDMDGCPRGSMIISNSGYFSSGEIYCIGDDLPIITTTKNLLLLVKSPPLPPVEFKFSAGGCGGEITNENPTGSIASPNYPDVFNGPLTCTWTSRSAMLVEVTHIDLLPDSDVLNLTDSAHNVSLTGSTHPYFVLLNSPSTLSFIGESVGVKTGFKLEYEFVNHQGLWNVSSGKPAMIVGWPGSQSRPSAWQIVGPKEERGLTIMVWAAYIPSDPECATHFLHVGGMDEEGQRVCGGAGLRTIHVMGHEALIILHTTSPLSILAASVHVMA